MPIHSRKRNFLGKHETLVKWTVFILSLMMALGPFSFAPANFFLPRIEVKKAQAAVANTVIFITSTASTTWTVPNDWNNSSNTIEVIGGGGGGGQTTNGGGGGGGGAYAKISNFSTSTTGGSVRIQVGEGGGSGASGTITFFNWKGTGSTSTCAAGTMSLCAATGGRGVNSVPGAGGQATASVATSTFGIGTSTFSGGAGGNGTSTGTDSSGGGGGAAGPLGIGQDGGQGDGNSAAAEAHGGGGGAGGGSSTPGTQGGADGGAGGNGPGGTGGGAGGANTDGNPGSDGGGGGGGDDGFSGGKGATSTAWTSNGSTAGPGGGGGGGGDTSNIGGDGGLYGGGGGGVDLASGGGAGGQGIIVITYTPKAIILADGTQPASVTVGPTSADAPGTANATTSAVFTFATNFGTSTITNVTTTVSTSSGIYQVLITDNAASTVYGSSTNPSSNSFNIALSGMNVSTTATTFKLLVNPKSHANMPGVPGGTYIVTSTISGWLDSKSLIRDGSNTTSSVITIDNASPGEVTSTSTTPGQGQIDLVWTNPGDTDFSNLVIVRATSSAVTGNPTEGQSYSSGNAIGNGIVMYTGSGTSVSDTGLSDNTTYHYKIWAKDTRGNYSASGMALSATTNAAAQPVIRTAANETFTVSSTSIAIAAITVTSTAASQITAANDIRITIATSSTNFRWDTSDTLATISGTGDVSSTVSYEDASSTLVVNVLSDFANASSVTISGLSYRDFNAVNAATTTFDLKWQGVGQSPPFARAASTTVTIRGRLDVGQHSTGQKTNQFNSSSTCSSCELFAFQLNPQDEAASTTLVIQLSSVSGVITGDVTGALIYEDTDANGTLSGGETTTNFGTGSVSISGGTGTITFNSPALLSVATSTRFIMKATTTALLAGDTMTVGLGASNVSATGTTSSAALSPTSASAPSNIAHTVPAVSRTQRSFRFQNDDGASVNSNTNLVSDWYDPAWGYRQKITIDHLRVGSSSGDLFNFPVLVSVTTTTLKTTASGGQVASSTGNDILFTDSNGVNKLNHEIEIYASSTGQLAAWVQVPRVSTSTDTVLYIYYGNASATNQQNVTSVWDSNFALVSHFGAQNASSSDSTVNANNGTVTGATATTTGAIAGYAKDLSGTNQYITVSATTSINNFTRKTISMWIVSDNTTAVQALVTKDRYGTGWEFVYNGATSPDRLDYNVQWSGATAEFNDPQGITGNVLHHVALTYDGNATSNMPIFYVDGIASSTTRSVTPSGSLSNDNAQNLFVGQRGTSLNRFDGRIDEVRYSDIIRSAGWILTEYNNGSSPDTFSTFATQETSSTVISSLVARIGQRRTLRMQVDNDGGGETGGILYKLQFQANATSGAWSDVAAGTAIAPSLGLAGADNAAITSAVAASNSRIFTNGTWNEGDGVTDGTVTLGNAGYTEFGFMLETSNAVASTTYYFRLYNNTGNAILDGYSVYPSLTTATSGAQLFQYSKNAGSLSTGTSSLTYFFDDIDYSNVSSSNNTYATTTAAANIPVVNFRVKNSTSSHPVKVTWEGQYSAASTTFLDAYRFGSTNAWQTLTSTSTPSINTDFTLTANITTSTSEYYQADGTDFWTYFRVRQATTTGSLRTDFFNVEFEPFLESSADQTFEISQATTSVSQIRVKASRTPVITAANDIRIKIPSSFNMSWATSTLVATLGGSASGIVSSTVSYPDDKTLLLDVTSDFVQNDDLTISGLSFKNFMAASASTSLQAFYDGSGDTAADALDSKLIQIRGTYVLGNHPVGQENNKFEVSTGSVAAAELLGFQVAPSGENATTSQIVVNLSNILGLITANITNAELRVDSNGDGAISGGETTTVGGAGSILISGQTGSITFSTAFDVTSTMKLILRADVASIDPEDSAAFTLQPSGITVTGQTSQIALAVSGSSPSASHGRLSARSGGGSVEFGPPSVSNQGGGGAGGGGASDGGGTPPPNQGGGGQSGGGGTP